MFGVQFNVIVPSDSYPLDSGPEILKFEIFSRLITKLQAAISRSPLDFDFLEFTCRQELYLLEALSRHVNVPEPILQAFQHLFRLVMSHSNCTDGTVATIAGETGRPRYDIDQEILEELLDVNLPVSCIAKLLGVSRSTINRRMREFGVSARQTYSTLTDEELDDAVIRIKNEMPSSGYRMVKGRLRSTGIHVQWRRVIASIIVRRTYSVKGPLSLWHVDTNHKLIRYNIVIFGAVDGYSRKVSYIITVFLSFTEDLFSVHMTFLPKLMADLEAFVEGWNNHPPRTEGNQTPEQLWHAGLDIQEPDVDWDFAADFGEHVDGAIVVPEFPCPFTNEEMAELQLLLHQNENDCTRTELYLVCREYVAAALSGTD
uniref:Integrase core domain-containing protein n=1 Tax=Oryzias melastigma TaxID=30732 RepID=A0A3B3BMS2_ORYME